MKPGGPTERILKATLREDQAGGSGATPRLGLGANVGENATKWAANFWIWTTPQQSTYLRPSLRGLEHDLAAPTAAEAAELTAELGVAEPPKKTRFDRF